MKAILPLSIAGVIISFLIGALAAFPLRGQTASPVVSGDDSFSVEATQEMANRFGSVYGAVIDDLISYQRDPDYRRVEAQRQTMVSYADSLVTRFQDFSRVMQGKLDELTVQTDSSQALAQ